MLRVFPEAGSGDRNAIRGVLSHASIRCACAIHSTCAIDACSDGYAMKRCKNFCMSASSAAPSARATFSFRALRLPPLSSSRMRCSASMETLVASSIDVAPQLNEHLDLGRSPGACNVRLKFLQARRNFVQLLFAQFKQPPPHVWLTEFCTTLPQLVNERLDSAFCGSPMKPLGIKLVPCAIERDVIVEQMAQPLKAQILQLAALLLVGLAAEIGEGHCRPSSAMRSIAAPNGPAGRPCGSRSTARCSTSSGQPCCSARLAATALSRALASL